MFETHNKRGREIIGHLSYLLLSEDTLAATHRVREAGPAGAPKPRLLDRVREAVRARHYSRRTEKTYVAWVRRYILKSVARSGCPWCSPAPRCAPSSSSSRGRPG